MYIRSVGKAESIVYCIHSPDSVFFIDEDGNTDFRCGDHINVYPFIVKALKHLGSHARIAEHTGANNGKLGDIALRVKLLEAKALLALLQSGNCIIQIDP